MYIAALHSSLGSTGEAMDPQKPVLLETLDEVEELQQAVWAADPYGGELDIRYFELPRPMTLEEAKAHVLSASYFEDDDDDDD